MLQLVFIVYYVNFSELLRFEIAESVRKSKVGRGCKSLNSQLRNGTERSFLGPFYNSTYLRNSDENSEKIEIFRIFLYFLHLSNLHRSPRPKQVGTPTKARAGF